ncbi:hypothetical protein, partial [Vibrio vulnificus]
AIDQNCRSRSRWCRGFYEKLIARSRYLNSGISCGMTDDAFIARLPSIPKPAAIFLFTDE